MVENLADLTLGAYARLLRVAQLAFLAGLFILLPMALIRRTRRTAGSGFVIMSYLFGIVTWLLGAAVTFSSYGWLGLLAGLLFLGVGVIPMAVFAAFFRWHLPDLGVSLVLMSVLTLVARFGGVYLMSRDSAHSEQAGF